MATKKTSKKTAGKRIKKLTVDPTRLALAALDRIKTVLVKTGHADRIGEPATMRELVARGAAFGGAPLPPSYSGTLRVASRIGEPEILLDSAGMAEARAEVTGGRAGSEGERYVPFCRTGATLICFDRRAPAHNDELPVIEWTSGLARPRARHFGEWLDQVADDREESVEHAASIPARLKQLLLDLGFRFDYPVVGRLETGDVRAVEELVGLDRAREIRGDVDRLFDSSGKASLTLNLDEFTLAISLRTGIFVFEAEDAFRWLRYFRDENFFGEQHREPSHPDQVRDLRKAGREPPLILRGVLEMACRPAVRHTFRAASGVSASDFYVLGRTASTSLHAPSLILHIVNGAVSTAHALDEPLNDLYAMPDGTLWGLAQSTAIRFVSGTARAYPLQRPTSGRTWWYGIGSGADRVLVWGAGALLEFDGDSFRPFAPEAGLDLNEAVVALCGQGRNISMLVCGDEHMGAVAHYDGLAWAPITEAQVIEGNLCDVDVWRGVTMVLDRGGVAWRLEGGTPRKAVWDYKHQAFSTEAGTLRPGYAIRGFDGGSMVASDGGAIVIGAGDPVFHAATGCRDEGRLARVGSGRVDGDVGIVAMVGPHLWIYKGGSFQVVDVADW
jgi:hypothetical protein